MSKNKYNNNDEIALLFRRVFNSQDGKDVYDILVKKFRTPSLCPQACADGMALMALTQMRIGEENVVRFIDSLLNREVGKNDNADNAAD